MLEVEVVGARLAPKAPPEAEIQRLCAIGLASAGIEEGHVAVQFVTSEQIARLNAQYRGEEGPTDVLSFPIDGPYREDIVSVAEEPGGARELGDVVICPEHTADLREAIVHGALHLAGMDHETDEGEMLALQRELLDWDRRTAGA